MRAVTESRAPARPPLATLGLVAASLAVSFALPASALRESLVLERAAVLRGQLWRLWTGHLVHDQGRHAFWNLAAFAALGAWAERRERARFAWTLGLAAPLSALAVVALRPDLDRYVGASALASALYVFAALRVARESDDRLSRAAGALALALFAAKLGLEALHRWPSPAIDPASGVESVVLAHVVGGAVGAAVALAGVESGAGRTTWHFRRRSRR